MNIYLSETEFLKAEIKRLQEALAEQPAQQEPVGHSVIAGALFDFMGWLTSRKERLVLSSTDDASPAVEAIDKFAKMRGLSLDDAKVQDWHTTPQPAQQEPVAWPAGLIERIKAAEQRIQDGHAPRRIPADPTDVDLVLAEVRYLLEGKQPPFWVNTTPQPAQRKPLTDEEIMAIGKALGLKCRLGGNPNIDFDYARAIEAKLKEKNT